MEKVEWKANTYAEEIKNKGQIWSTHSIKNQKTLYVRLITI